MKAQRVCLFGGPPKSESALGGRCGDWRPGMVSVAACQGRVIGLPQTVLEAAKER